MDVKIHPSWKKVLAEEFEKPYFFQIVNFIKTERELGKIIYPPGSQIFSAFNETSVEDVKVVIIGQDPYHGAGQANGLCFSVNANIKVPPSLQNIFIELKSDLGIEAAVNYGNLDNWAKQGVLLLNASLTVRADEPLSHAKIGWEIFTDSVIKKISELKMNIVFLLWGKFAQNKIELIDETKHRVLKAAHPSPFSARNGFFGCKHFSKTNEILVSNGIDPINWKILPDQ